MTNIYNKKTFFVKLSEMLRNRLQDVTFGVKKTPYFNKHNYLWDKDTSPLIGHDGQPIGQRSDPYLDMPH